MRVLILAFDVRWDRKVRVFSLDWCTFLGLVVGLDLRNDWMTKEKRRRWNLAFTCNDMLGMQGRPGIPDSLSYMEQGLKRNFRYPFFVCLSYCYSPDLSFFCYLLTRK